MKQLHFFSISILRVNPEIHLSVVVVATYYKDFLEFNVIKVYNNIF